jgi:hypothetical protein
MVTQAIPPPPASGNFGARTCKFSERPEVLWIKMANFQETSLIKIRNLYSAQQVIKAFGEGGSFLSHCHFNAETTSPVRSESKEQRTEADHSST